MSGDAKNITECPLKLEDFKLKEVLFNNAAKKIIALVGNFPASEDDKGIVIVEKVDFEEESFTTENENDSILKHTDLEMVAHNDIYLNCLGLADRKFNSKFQRNFDDSKVFKLISCRIESVNHLPGNRKAHFEVYTAKHPHGQ
jgi:hypothetical protein